MSFLKRAAERRRERVLADFGSLTSVERSVLLRCARDPRPVEDLMIMRDRADVCVVAEVKKASPSEGLIAPGCSASAQARRYAAGGAAALSVLTEPEHFGGSFVDLSDAVEAVELPVMCKDIIVDPIQLYMARASGADAVLLMLSVLGASTPEYIEHSWSLGLGPVLEVATLDELDMAYAFGAEVIAVNARDLHTLKVDTAHQLEIVSEAAYGGDAFVIAASGIKTRADVEAAAAAGAHAVLVGTTLMRAPIPEDVLKELTGVPKGARL